MKYMFISFYVPEIAARVGEDKFVLFCDEDRFFDQLERSISHCNPTGVLPATCRKVEVFKPVGNDWIMIVRYISDQGSTFEWIRRDLAPTTD